ncbi:MAG: type II toxin-antitoxin system VapC family toxin [Mycobacteriales bacterium]
MIYLDSCALVKLIIPEAETAALRSYLDRHNDKRHIASSLARTEVRRALIRQNLGPESLSAAEGVLARFTLLGIDDALLDAAGSFSHRWLRSLDAIHLATGHSFKLALSAFVTYDKRLTEAADQLGLPTRAPV